MCAAIAGYGETAIGELPGYDPLELKMWAAGEAMEDAGIGPDDVDGLVTSPPMDSGSGSTVMAVAQSLGLCPIRWGSTPDLGGASFVQTIAEAEMAVERGYCDVMLVVAADALRSAVGVDRVIENLSGLASRFEEPSNLVPSLYAHVANWQLDRTATTREHLAAVAAIDYGHAAMQREARAHENEPMDVGEVLAAPTVADPLTIPQCSLISDGGAAVVVASEEVIAGVDADPVRLQGFGAQHTHKHLSSMPDPSLTGARAAGERAMRRAGVDHDDIDVLEIYDCFTITVVRVLEDLGFCPPGGVGQLVERGDLELGGRWPMNTHGGALAGGHPGPVGIFHVTEAVRQLRGEAEATQVEGADTALVHGNGGVFSTQGVAILERGA
jgi:acetyl-CoA acetyltransferase